MYITDYRIQMHSLCVALLLEANGLNDDDNCIALSIV